MSNALEQQDDEREALQSIYEGDEAYKEISPTIFHYKYGVDGDRKSFLVEIQWGENYPNEKPYINMETFYNRNLSSNIKEKIRIILLEEAEHWIGCAMTYSLFECIKDSFTTLSSEIMDSCETIKEDLTALQISDNVITTKKGETKKEHLTKAQKRRQWDRGGASGDLPRGWNWVDIVKHLSQTGHKDENQSSSNVV